MLNQKYIKLVDNAHQNQCEWKKKILFKCMIKEVKTQ